MCKNHHHVIDKSKKKQLKNEAKNAKNSKDPQMWMEARNPKGCIECEGLAPPSSVPFSSLKIISGKFKKKSRKGEIFELFPNLPPELRFMIWKEAFVPRLVVPLTGEVHSEVIALSNFQAILPSMHTSRESRMIFEENYSKVFGTYHHSVPHYFNFSIDVLSFDMVTEEEVNFGHIKALVAEYPLDMMRVRYLEMANPILDIMDLSGMPALEQLTIAFVDFQFQREVQMFENDNKAPFSSINVSKARIVVVGGHRRRNNASVMDPEPMLLSRIHKTHSDWRSSYHWNRLSTESTHVVDVGRAVHSVRNRAPHAMWEFMAEVVPRTVPLRIVEVEKEEEEWNGEALPVFL